ncbi:MAG: radical SAM protein, partial [Clostridia bacterium]|nr:radical SAM protein [Clostridia bacterium]
LQGIRNALDGQLSVSINTPLCSLNADYVETLSFLHRLGVRFVTCSGMIVTGNAKEAASEKMWLSKEELYQILQAAAAFCRENDMEIQFTSPGWIEADKLKELGLQVPSCGACLSNMAVTPDGKAVPCQSALSGIALGDMRKESFTKIWNSQACRKQRKFAAQMTQICPLREDILH